MKTRTDISNIESQMVAALRTLRRTLDAPDGSEADVALTELETFVAVALRVMSKANPSKVRDCARTTEIKIWMDAGARA